MSNDSKSSGGLTRWFVLLTFVVGASAVIVWIESRVLASRRPSSYPQRPVKVIVPFGAGGSTDTFARKMQEAIGENDLLPVPMVVINKAGAGATIGSRHVKDRDPDGYTMLVLHDTMFTAEAFKTVEYGSDAFQPIAATGENGMMIAVRKESDYQSLEQLMNDVADRPGEIIYANNTGALVQFAALYLAKLQNEKRSDQISPPASFRLVQSGGGAQRFEDVEAGRADVSGFSVDEYRKFQSELRALAYLGAERHPAFVDEQTKQPNIPTAREQGFEIVHKNTVYWWFPKGTPAECVDVMAGVLAKAMKTEVVQRFLDDTQSDDIVLRGDALMQRIAHSKETYSSVSLNVENPVPDIPLMLTIAIGILLVGVIAESRFQGAGRIASPSERYTNSNLATLSVVLTLAYVTALSLRIIDFRIVTAAYLFVLGTMLARKPEAQRAMVVVSLGLSIGVYYLFTHLFVVDLP